MPSMPAAHYHQGLPCRDRSCAAANVPLEPGDLPEGKQSKSVSWTEAIEISKRSFDEIEQRRAALAEREGRACDALCRDVEEDRDRLAAELEQLRADHGKLAATIAAFPDAHNAANLAHARMERDALRAEVARVRADVAEEIARAIEMSCECAGETDPHIVDACEYRAAARIARDHAAAPAESVVGAPTPISSPSDVAAPRDALTDQDFADLRADVEEARGRDPLHHCCDDRGLGCGHHLDGHGRGAGTNCTQPGCQCPVWRDHVNCAHRGSGALPEDEGTRQPDDPGSDAAVGRRLRDERVAAGLSLRDAAARLGIEARQLADVEHGRTTAPNWLLARVASEIAPMTEGDSDDRPLAAH